MNRNIAHLGRRVHEVLSPINDDSVWHCDPCETEGRLTAFSTQRRLEAHIAAGHPAQADEEIEYEHAICKHIDSQMIDYAPTIRESKDIMPS